MSDLVKYSDSKAIPTTSDELLDRYDNGYPQSKTSSLSSTGNLYPLYIYPSDKVTDEVWCYSASLNDSFSLSRVGIPKGLDLDKDVKIFNKEGEPITILGFKGVPLLIELQPALQWYDDKTKKFTKICSVVGSEYSGSLINTLPVTPWGNMYHWDSIKDKSFNLPSNEVQNLGLIGSRGQMCVDCITSGKSIATDPNGKEHKCEVTGVLYMYVTDIPVVVSKMNGPVEQFTIKDRAVENLVDEEGKAIKPFLVAIRLSPSSLSRGWHANKNLVLTNITSYHRSLKYEPNKDKDSKPVLLKEGDPRSSISYSSVRIIAKRYYNKDESLSIKPIVTVECLGHNPSEQEKALELWKATRPTTEIRTIPFPTTSNIPSLESEIVPYQEDDDNW